MNTNNGPTNDDIELLKAVQRIIRGLKHTGVTLVVLSTVAGVSAVADYPHAATVVVTATSLIFARGLNMMINAANLLRQMDAEILAELSRPRRGTR